MHAQPRPTASRYACTGILRIFVKGLRIISMACHRRYLVTGLVQGVGFRYHAQKQARMLALAGWVRNLPDGRVELQASGPEDLLDKMHAWLLHGPSISRVSNVSVENIDLDESPVGFTIR